MLRSTGGSCFARQPADQTISDQNPPEISQTSLGHESSLASRPAALPLPLGLPWLPAVWLDSRRHDERRYRFYYASRSPLSPLLRCTTMTARTTDVPDLVRNVRTPSKLGYFIQCELITHLGRPPLNFILVQVRQRPSLTHPYAAPCLPNLDDGALRSLAVISSCFLSFCNNLQHCFVLFVLTDVIRHPPDA